MSIKQRARRVGLAALVIASLAAWVGLPAPADARLPKDLKEELQGHVDKVDEVEDAEATQALLMLQGRVGGRSARKALSAKADSDEARVKLGATMGLWLSGDRRARNKLVEQLEDDKKLYLTLREVVTVLPDDKEKVLLKRLIKAADDKRQEDVLRYAAQQHGDLYEILGSYLTGRDEQLRKAAIKAALFTTRDEAADWAGKMLSSRREAIRADGLDLAIALTGRPGGSSKAEAVLEGALGDRSDDIAEKAARHLVRLGNSKGAKKLEKELASAKEDERKKKLARHLLEHRASVSTDTAQPLIDSDDDAISELGWQLAASSGDEEIFQKLREMFGSTVFDERVVAVKALGRTGNKGAVGMLGKALFEGNADLRRHAAVSLGQLGEPRALTALKKALSGERDREVKLAVVNAVSHIDAKESLSLLRFQTTARDPQVKLAVVRAIRRLGHPDGARALKVVRNDRNLEVKWEVFLTTLELDSKSGLRMLESALRNPPDGFMDDIEQLDEAVRSKILAYVLAEGTSATRADALSSARRIGEPLFDVFRELVADTDTPDDVRRELLLALSEKRDPKDVGLFEKLVRKSGSEELSRLALWTLAEYGAEQTEATLRGLLADDDNALRSIAAYALSTIHDK